MQCRTKKIMSALWCAVVAGGFSSALVLPASAAEPAAPATASAANPNMVVATVNNDKILMSSVSNILDKIKTQATIPQADLDKMRDEIIEDLIIERLLVNEARAQKLMPPEQKVDDAIWNLQKPFSSKAAFLESIKKNGKTEADLRLVLAEDMAITALSKKVTSDIAVSDAEVETFYKEHLTEFLVPEMVHVRHIQISVKADANPIEKDKLKKQATDLLKKATAAGADFAKLARENSQDVVSAKAGGDLGFIARDDIMDKAFGDAAFSGAEGKVYPKVVETKFGYNILKVDTKKASRTLALTEVASYVKPRLLQKKYKERMDAKVAELRKAARITYAFPKATT